VCCELFVAFFHAPNFAIITFNSCLIISSIQSDLRAKRDIAMRSRNSGMPCKVSRVKVQECHAKCRVFKCGSVVQGVARVNQRTLISLRGGAGLGEASDAGGAILG